jgi:hypothetical protein
MVARLPWACALASLLAVLPLAGCGAGPAASGGGGGGGAAAGSCNAGTAGGPSNITVPQEPTSGVDKLTGSCWSKIAPTPIAHVLSSVGTGAIPGGKPGTVQLAWDQKNLYIKCNVYEWPLHAAGAHAWQDDACEFMVSGSNTHAGTFGDNDAQIIVAYNSNTPELGNHGGNIADASSFQAQTSVQSGSGYMVELTVPWSTLGVAKPAKGQTYQFDVAVDYNDSNGQYIAYADLTGENPNPCCSTQNWGQITLG